MPLISRIGRRDPKVVGLLGGILLVLTLGAVGMVVPFLLMLSGSTKTGIDQYEHRVIPRFLQQDEALYRKYVEALFNESQKQMRSTYAVTNSFQTLPLPNKTELGGERIHPVPGFFFAPSSRGIPEGLRRARALARKEVDGDLAAFNAKYQLQIPAWRSLVILPVDLRSRKGLGGMPPWVEDVIEHPSAPIPEWMFRSSTVESLYRELYGADLNPDDPHFEDFVRTQVHPEFLRLDVEALSSAWSAYLRAQYPEGTDQVWGIPLEQVPLRARWSVEMSPVEQTDWLRFLEGWRDPGTALLHQADLSSLQLERAAVTPDSLRLRDAQQFYEHRDAIRRVFLFQNVHAVWDVLVTQGRGIFNTVVYCFAAIVLALLVNPLAAYGLSRFRPRHTYSLLLVMLLTMAFPPMVTQIPVFLMLRDFGLLNTFWALLLPGMAHGYSIFLLKGFFDSLPRELYESASLDGAGEWRMFWTITMSLSKPILAVIALSAFVAAYTNFMFALLICQDERMWTLMVWLYQLQQQHGPGVMNASFLIAAVPTLLVFLFCQNLIMRGIVVPAEK